jgi:hypothetical protein
MKTQRELLDSILGLSVKTILILLSFFSGLRFANVRQVAALIRVSTNPAVASAENPESRKWAMPSFAAMVAVNKTEWDRAFKARLAASGKRPMVIIFAMARSCRRRYPQRRKNVRSGSP